MPRYGIVHKLTLGVRSKRYQETPRKWMNQAGHEHDGISGHQPPKNLQIGNTLPGNFKYVEFQWKYRRFKRDTLALLHSKRALRINWGLNTKFPSPADWKSSLRLIGWHVWGRYAEPMKMSALVLLRLSFFSWFLLFVIFWLRNFEIVKNLLFVFSWVYLKGMPNRQLSSIENTSMTRQDPEQKRFGKPFLSSLNFCRFVGRYDRELLAFSIFPIAAFTGRPQKRITPTSYRASISCKRHESLGWRIAFNAPVDGESRQRLRIGKKRAIPLKFNARFGNYVEPWEYLDMQSRATHTYSCTHVRTLTRQGARHRVGKNSPGGPYGKWY